ncbi:MAG: hypothetical protein V1725_07775 [archaeon]
MNIERRVSEILSQKSEDYARYWWRQGFSDIIQHARLDQQRFISYLAISTIAKPHLLKIIKNTMLVSDRTLAGVLSVGNTHYLKFALSTDLRFLYETSPYTAEELPIVSLHTYLENEAINNLLKTGLITEPHTDLLKMQKDVLHESYTVMNALLTAASTQLRIRVSIKYKN